MEYAGRIQKNISTYLSSEMLNEENVRHSHLIQTPLTNRWKRTEVSNFYLEPSGIGSCNFIAASKWAMKIGFFPVEFIKMSQFV